MNRIKLLSLLVIALLCAACAKDVDYKSVSFTFSVVDSQGNDLFDPESGSYVGEGVTVEYEGQVYALSGKVPRVYHPDFQGLQLMRGDEGWLMAFGELDGGCDYDSDFVITLPDGSSHTMHYRRQVIHSLTVAREQWTFDGVKVECPVQIVYDPSGDYLSGGD